MNNDEWGRLDRKTKQLKLIAAKKTATSTLDTFVATLKETKPIEFTNDQLVGEKIQEVPRCLTAARGCSTPITHSLTAACTPLLTTGRGPREACGTLAREARAVVG